MVVIILLLILSCPSWTFGAGLQQEQPDWCTSQPGLVSALPKLQEPPPYLSAHIVSVDPDREEESPQRVFDLPGGPLEVELPLDWNQDPYGDRSWRFWVHSLYFLEPLLQRYDLRSDSASLRFALQIALDWIDSNLGRSQGISEFVWYDMAVGARAAYLAYLLRSAAFDGLLPHDQMCRLGEVIEVHANWLAKRENYNDRNNHGLYQDAGLFIVGTLLPWHSRAAAWTGIAERRFASTLSKTVNVREGIHLEHSPAYHATITRLLGRFRGMGLGVSLPDDLPDLMARNLQWFVMPDDRYAQLGDTDLVSAPKGEVPNGLKVFPESGYGIVRQSGEHLILAAAYHAHTHKHSDELTFSLAHDGRRVVIDAGRFGYYYDTAERKYVVSSRAHNTMIFGNREFSFREHPPYGSGIIGGSKAGDWYLLAGANPMLTPIGIRHQRFLFYQPGQALIVLDRVRSRAPVESTRFLHFHGDLTVRETAEGVVFVEDEEGRRIATACTVGPDAGTRLEIIRGVEKPQLQGFTSPRNRVMEPTSALLFKAEEGPEFSAVVIEFADKEDALCASSLKPIEVTVAHEETFQVSLTSDQRSLTLVVDHASEAMPFSVRARPRGSSQAQDDPAEARH